MSTELLEIAPRPGNVTSDISDSATRSAIETLSADELAELLKCEDTIRRGLKSFVEVGRALQKIKEARLYRVKYGTFKEYLAREWGMSDRYARNITDGEDAYSLLEQQKFAVLPTSESQVRPLLQLPRVEWISAWEEVVGTAGASKITANHVATVVQRRLDRLSPPAKPELSGALTEEAQESKPIDLVDLSSRENQIRAVARETQLRLRELAELLVSAGNVKASIVVATIHSLDDLQEDLNHVERVRSERAEGLRPENLLRHWQGKLVQALNGRIEQKPTEETK